MSKYLAAFLAVAGFVSAQDYSSLSSTTEAADTTTATYSPLIPPTTTPASTLTTALDGSIIDSSGSSYTTEIFYYCTAPTLSAPTLSIIGPFVTIYNTIYVDINPTGGLTQVTYTITDTCGCTHQTDYTRPTGCPSGFTTTEKTCTMCPGSPVITCTTPIITLSSETSNPTTTAPAGSNSGSNTQYPPGSQNPQYTKPGSTSSSAPGTKPSYATTNDAKLAAGSSSLGLLMVMSMAIVGGLMCIM